MSKRRGLTNTQITDRIFIGSAILGLVFLVFLANHIEPGFWSKVIDVAGQYIDQFIDEIVQPLAAFVAVGYGTWKAAAYVTRRDTLQEVAQNAAREQREPTLLPIGDN